MEITIFIRSIFIDRLVEAAKVYFLIEVMLAAKLDWLKEELINRTRLVEPVALHG